MRILVIVTNGLKREGIATTQLEYFRLMDKTDMIVDIASVREYQTEVIEEFESYGCNVIEFPNREKHVAGYIKRLWKVLHENKYDILHIHGSSCLMAMDLYLAKKAHVKVRIAHSRNTRCDHKVINILLRPLFNRSYNVAFSCGEDAGKWLFKDAPYTVIHNGKDLEKFRFSENKRKEMRDKFNLNGSFAVGFVGNLKEQKNPFFLLDVFKSIYENNSNARFFIMGDGNMRHSLEMKSAELGIQEVTLFMGRISNVNEMLQAMDLMLLPSKWEGLPNVVLEWQSCGLPCIISDVITWECKVSDLVNYKSIEDSPEEWAKAALELGCSKTRKTNSDICRQRLMDEGFDLKKNVVDLRNTYFSLTASDLS